MTSSTKEVLAITTLDGQPVAMLAAGQDVLLANGREVTVLDAATLRPVNHIELGKPVSCLAVSRDGSRLYVGDYDGAVTALEMRTARPDLRAAS